MRIGLIGGIGPAAQDYYCRQLISLFADANAHLDLTIGVANLTTLLTNQAADRRDEQAEIFAGLAERLKRAGAGCIAVTSIAGHFCHQEFAVRANLPVVDMTTAVSDDLSTSGLKRVGILGTRIVMETHFYGGLGDLCVLPPLPSELDLVHQAYVDMAKAGAVNAEQLAIFNQAVDQLIKDQGAEAIILGGTDLGLAFDAKTCGFTLIDCAAIHAKAIASFALGQD